MLIKKNDGPKYLNLYITSFDPSVKCESCVIWKHNEPLRYRGLYLGC